MMGAKTTLPVTFLIRVDGTMTPIEPKGKTFTLKEIHDLVEGYVQCVSLRHFRKKTDLIMLCNEEGLLQGLPLNPVASRLAHQLLRRETPIVGPVVICHPKLFK